MQPFIFSFPFLSECCKYYSKPYKWNHNASICLLLWREGGFKPYSTFSKFLITNRQMGVGWSAMRIKLMLGLYFELLLLIKTNCNHYNGATCANNLSEANLSKMENLGFSTELFYIINFNIKFHYPDTLGHLIQILFTLPHTIVFSPSSFTL